MSAYFVPLYGYITWKKFSKTHNKRNAVEKLCWRTQTEPSCIHIRAMQLISKFGVLSQWACYLISESLIRDFRIFAYILVCCCVMSAIIRFWQMTFLSLKLRLILFQWKSVKNHNSTFDHRIFLASPLFLALFPSTLNTLIKFEQNENSLFNTCTTCVISKSDFFTQCVDFHLKFFIGSHVNNGSGATEQQVCSIGMENQLRRSRDLFLKWFFF